MSDPRNELTAAKLALVEAFVHALESGITLAETLALLGVEGKAATMIRAFLSRYSDAQIAAMLREVAGAESLDGGIRDTEARAEYTS